MIGYKNASAIRAAALVMVLSSAVMSCACSDSVTDTVMEDTNTAYTAAEANVPDGSYQLIPDVSFETGIELISQKDHSDGDSFSVLATHDFRTGESAASPVWRLAQWDSGPDLVSMLTESEPSLITDGKWRAFGYDPDSDVIKFLLDTSLYYGGNPARTGDYWPHLLLEQADFGYAGLPDAVKPYYSCGADKLIVTFDIRLNEYEAEPIDGDWVRAAQFLMYFYVKGVDTNDFCWFGLQLFDNRYDNSDNYIGYDGGKADASGAMIYSIGSKYVYENTLATLWNKGAPCPDGDWLSVEIDIKPFLEDMLEKGLTDGYFKADTLDELYIGGMNVGWETIATFRHEMEMRHLKLTSYIGK